MDQWNRCMQPLIDEIDACIRDKQDETLTLRILSQKFGYSESHFSRNFRRVSGMRLRDYLRFRRLAFALAPLREGRQPIVQIALDAGFSSHEAFTRAFQAAYGITPGQYRSHPAPGALHTILRPFDCWLLEPGAAADGVKTYLVTIPAHGFAYIQNRESIGYWDFWQRQNRIPGQDQATVCRLLEELPGKLDDLGGSPPSGSSGQLMAFCNDPAGRICSWGIPLAECWGARLPADYRGPVPAPLRLRSVPEGDYVVFEHGPFDVATESGLVEEKMERAMRDFAMPGVRLDLSPGRLFYFYYDGSRGWKYVRPVTKAAL